jgi:hypothetical protein
VYAVATASVTAIDQRTPSRPRVSRARRQAERAMTAMTAAPMP